MSAQCLIIGIGEGINSDGSQTERSEAVVEKVVELLKSGAGDSIFFSGGVGMRFVNSTPEMESVAMKRQAMSLGVSEDKIDVRDEGRDTLGEAIFGKQFAKQRGIHDVIVVAGRWHMLRTGYLFQTVFGPGYNITMVRAKDTFTEEQLDRIQGAEIISLSMSMSLFKEFGVLRGDDEAAMKMMKTAYRFYNENAIVTDAQRNMLRTLNKLRERQPLVGQKSYS